MVGDDAGDEVAAGAVVEWRGVVVGSRARSGWGVMAGSVVRIQAWVSSLCRGR